VASDGIEALLELEEDWAVVVRAEAWTALTDGAAILALRDALESEETLLDDAVKVLGPAGSSDRLKDSISYPAGTP
jgi:hypothetical protein